MSENKTVDLKSGRLFPRKYHIINSEFSSGLDLIEKTVKQEKKYNFKCKPTQLIRGKAKWIKTKKYKFLKIKTQDFYSLGYLEGKYLQLNINIWKHAINILKLLEENEIDYRKLRKHYMKYISEEHLDEMRGMADGSGMLITFKDIMIQQIFFDLTLGHIIPTTNNADKLEIGCTALGVRNKNGTIHIGQTFDLHPIVTPTLSFIQHKVGNKPDIFSLRLGGGLSCAVSKSYNQITSTINVIHTNLKGHFTEPLSFKIRRALENSDNAYECVQLLFNKNYKGTASFNFMFGDKKELFSIQANPNEYKIYDSRDKNPLVNTNRYINKAWNKEFFIRGDYSLARQERAEFLLGKLIKKENVDAKDLINILKTKSSNGKIGSEICRVKGKSQTIAFFTNSFFGYGNELKRVGKNPF